jgi:hypothetical protein
MAFLYCVMEDGGGDTGPCKVGVTNHLAGRLSSLQGGNSRRLWFAWFIELDRPDALELEAHLLRWFRPSIYGNGGRTTVRLASEWLAIGPEAIKSRADEYVAICFQKAA